MLPVGNRPMLWYCLKNLQESRFGDAIVLTRQEEQAEILAYLRQEFPNAFQRLEVVGLGREAETGKSRGDFEEDDVVCGTAEALLQIKHLLVTDFFVITCDVIGPVDFFSLASASAKKNEEKQPVKVTEMLQKKDERVKRRNERQSSFCRHPSR
ncbi:translation initiation factor eIF-2B subunit gamma [Toxoplasma gondii FOU]|uniref:Translation initiation factor eIF2B subunit gamma n=1 Tax=Toxoplasma gondii FOU TaxID=943167 RepID=A0A086JFI9_TOXGO|nr:translation initiation factor eIF-2B subunit gamma [Toxoplasma gondii FOU]